MPDSRNEVLTHLDHQILDRLMEGFQVISFDWRYLYLNEIVCKHGKYSKHELLGKTMMEKYPGIEQTKMFKTLQKCMNERVHDKIENLFTYPDGSQSWFELRIEPISEGLFILSIDITERKSIEKKFTDLQKELEERVAKRTALLEKANKEITTLYKEMHHRIKNNLQIIASMLNLQAENTNNPNLNNQLMMSKNRIQAIAQAHENLYVKDRIERISINDYLSELLEKIELSVLNEDCVITFDLYTEDIIRPIDFMVPLGLLTNELITNSVKHGFEGKTSGRINIELIKVQNGLKMTYIDNGKGISVSAIKNLNSLGVLLIESLAEQLNGEIDRSTSENGVKYQFIFKD